METKQVRLRKNISLGGRFIEITGMIYSMGGRKWYSFPFEMDGLNTSMIKTSDTKKKDSNEEKILNRFLDPKHKEGIKEYMKNEPNFTIPAITLVTRQDLKFIPHIFGEEPSNETTIDELIESNNGAISGVFRLPLNAKFECLDGNHRTVALKELADEMPELLRGSSVLLNVVFEKEDRKIKQDFVDVNKNAKLTTKSINTLFNTREPLPKLVADIRESYDYIKEVTNLMSTSISKNSNDLYTLNNIKNAIMELSNTDSQAGTANEKKLNVILKENEKALSETEYKITLFFDELKNNPTISQCLLHRSDTPNIRNNSIITSGIGIALASAITNEIINNYDEIEHKERINTLMNYDWSRSNPIFTQGGIISPIDGYTIMNSRGTFINMKKLLIELFIK